MCDLSKIIADGKLQGYMAGNPLTDESGDRNSRFEYAYHVALIPKELFEVA